MIPRFVPYDEVPTHPKNRGRYWALVLRSMEFLEEVEFTDLTPATIQNCYESVTMLRKQGLDFMTIKIWGQALRVKRIR